MCLGCSHGATGFNHCIVEFGLIHQYSFPIIQFSNLDICPFSLYLRIVEFSFILDWDNNFHWILNKALILDYIVKLTVKTSGTLGDGLNAFWLRDWH